MAVARLVCRPVDTPSWFVAQMTVYLPQYQFNRFQSVMNAAARLVFSASRYDHITPLLRQLNWLKAPERVEFKLAVLVYKCRQRTAPSYLFEELCQLADLEARRRLRSASSSSLVDCHMWLSTIGDRASPVAAARIWNGLPPHVTSACPLAACFSQSSEDAPLQTLLSMTPSSVFVVPVK